MKKTSPSFATGNWHLLPLVIIAIGILVRTLFIGSAPNGLNQDEASIAYDAWALLQEGIDRWGVSWPVHFIAWGSGQNALYGYLSMPFLAIGGVNALSIRAAASVLGVLTLLLVWRLAKRHDRITELVMVLIFATSPWHIMVSRWALESNVAPAFVLFGTYFVARYKDHFAFMAIGFSIITLAIYAYGTAYLFAPLYLATITLTLLISQKINWKKLLFPSLLSFLIALPIILFIANNKWGVDHISLGALTIPKYPGEARYSGIFLLFADNGLANIPENILAVIRMLIGGTSDGLPWNASPYFGPQLILLSPFFLIGLCLSPRSSRFIDQLMFMWFVCAFFVAILTSANINRINLIWIPSLWLSGVGLLSLRTNRKVLHILLAAIAIAGASFIAHYAISWHKEIAKHFFPGVEKAIIHTVKSVDREERIAVTYHSNPMSTLLYSETLPSIYVNTVDIADRNSAFVHVRSFDRFIFGIEPYTLNRLDNFIAHKSELHLFNPDVFSFRFFDDFASVSKIKPNTSCTKMLNPSEFTGEQDWGDRGLNAGTSQPDNSGIRFKDYGVFLSGLGVHGQSRYQTLLPNTAKTLSIGFGLTEAGDCSNGMRYIVQLNGEVLHESLVEKHHIKFIEIPLSAPNPSDDNPELLLELITTPEGGNQCDHGAWVIPQITQC